MNANETAAAILLDGVRAASEKRRVAAAYGVTWRDRRCPGCDQGLKVKTVVGGGATLLICPGCSFVGRVPFEMDEGNLIGQSFIAGVTGRRTPTVVFKADGSIKEIRNG